MITGERDDLGKSKTILLDLRTDKLLTGEKKYLRRFRSVLEQKVIDESDATHQILQQLRGFLDEVGDPLTIANITSAFIDDFTEMAIKEYQYDIITAPYFPMKSDSIPLSEIIDLNKKCITATLERMSHLGVRKDIAGVICVSPTLLRNKEVWDSLCEILDMEVDMWCIRLSSLNFDTKTILSFLWEFIDNIVPRIGANLLVGLDFELYDDGPFGFPLLPIGLDVFSSCICETDEFRRQANQTREKPFGFYYLCRERVKKHISELLPDDIQCDCPVCRNLTADFFGLPLDKNALKARLEGKKPLSLIKDMKSHFIYCREQEIAEYEKVIKNEDFLTLMIDIARNASHPDWENILDQGRQNTPKYQFR